MGRVERWTSRLSQNTLARFSKKTRSYKTAPWNKIPLSRESTHRFEASSSSFLPAAHPSLPTPRSQHFPLDLLPGLLPKGKLTEADVTHYFSFPYNVFQNWYSIIVILQMQYVLMRKHRQQKDTHNPKQPEITNVNTLVYSLCIPYTL